MPTGKGSGRNTEEREQFPPREWGRKQRAELPETAWLGFTSTARPLCAPPVVTAAAGEPGVKEKGLVPGEAGGGGIRHKGGVPRG